MTVFMFLLGLAGLVLGAELLVRGASRLGLAIGMSPLVIGLTIVAFGTSSPELAVSIKAALTDHPDIILGTCIGSSIFNILFILGVSALIAPLVVSQQLIWYEVPIMIGAHLLLLAMCFDGKIDTIDAIILIGGIVGYTIFAIRKGRRESKAITDEYEKALPSEKMSGSKPLIICKQLGFIITGLVLCVLGAGWLLDSSVVLARALGMSELVIAMTIVAAGTSFPEVATSIVATIRGERDIAIGNVVGSNIFNILGIIGVAGFIAPGGIPIAPSVLRIDLPIAIAACVACLPIFFSGHKISRWEGILFLGYYAAYISYLILAANGHDSLPMFSSIMMWIVIPLTLLTFVIMMYRTTRNHKF
ncbi:MAG: calcium/sodium antiporter [Parachlamydiaceae bacterium]|nr:calcium/sodium antiporter [Parachlamydiaceae bacterium]